MMIRRIGLFLLALICAVASSPTFARQWKPSPSALATDYSQIIDNRGGHELIMLWWLAAPVLSNNPQIGQAARDMLDKYVVVGLVHTHISAAATFSFDDVSALQASDASSTALTPLAGDAMPPTVVGLLATLESSLGQALGPMGKGIHWFVFDSGSVHACEKGSLSLSFAGETYTYHTPIPGCS